MDLVWEGVRQRVGQRVWGRGWDAAEDDHVVVRIPDFTHFYLAPKSLATYVRLPARAQAARPPLAASALSAVPPPVPSPRVAAEI